MTTITQTILELRTQWPNLSPQEINNGDCDGFAVCVENKGFGYAVWGDEIPYKLWLNPSHKWINCVADSHCFIEYKNRFYDSECPQGCNHPDELPTYQRIFLHIK